MGGVGGVGSSQTRKQLRGLQSKLVRLSTAACVNMSGESGLITLGGAPLKKMQHLYSFSDL